LRTNISDFLPGSGMIFSKNRPLLMAKKSIQRHDDNQIRHLVVIMMPGCAHHDDTVVS
jgi:hypothetical protein